MNASADRLTAQHVDAIALAVDVILSVVDASLLGGEAGGAP